ncbi:hypothetical protein SAMN03159341_101455 [Paenibacillus sp. 1_12]|nr:hypothetical protein SAMN03159341_101455 [Paenibacillus sp. 1_12]
MRGVERDKEGTKELVRTSEREILQREGEVGKKSPHVKLYKRITVQKKYTRQDACSVFYYWLTGPRLKSLKNLYLRITPLLT